MSAVDVGARGGERGQPPLDDFLLARAHRDRRRARASCAAAGARLAVRMLCSSSASRAGVIVEPARRVRRRRIVAVGVGRDRQPLVVVARRRTRRRVRELQLLPLEHGAVLIAENRDQHLVRELVLHRMPLDVEEAREARARAVLEDVQPPRVRRLARCPCGSAPGRARGPCRARRSASIQRQ